MTCGIYKTHNKHNIIMSASKEMFTQMREEENKPQSAPLSQGLTMTSNNLLKMDMATIETIARQIVTEVRDGNLDPMDVLIYAKKGAAFFKCIDDNVKNVAYAKSYATKGETYRAHGCKVDQAELGVIYSFSECNDPIYNDILNHFNKVKKQKDDREKFLKSIKGSLDIVVNDAEVVTIKEPIKSGTVGYKITIQ